MLRFFSLPVELAYPSTAQPTQGHPASPALLCGGHAPLRPDEGKREAFQAACAGLNAKLRLKQAYGAEVTFRALRDRARQT